LSVPYPYVDSGNPAMTGQPFGAYLPGLSGYMPDQQGYFADQAMGAYVDGLAGSGGYYYQ